VRAAVTFVLHLYPPRLAFPSIPPQKINAQKLGTFHPLHTFVSQFIIHRMNSTHTTGPFSSVNSSVFACTEIILCATGNSARSSKRSHHFSKPGPSLFSFRGILSTFWPPYGLSVRTYGGSVHTNSDPGGGNDITVGACGATVGATEAALAPAELAYVPAVSALVPAEVVYVRTVPALAPTETPYVHSLTVSTHFNIRISFFNLKQLQ
jgi:hypothetical protein